MTQERPSFFEKKEAKKLLTIFRQGIFQNPL